MTRLPFTDKLMRWNEESNSRRMPWKGEPDPYRIWLSEIILQQTRVEQGWKYYERFILQYPAVSDLAAAPEKEVFKLWEGLGYYSRCRNLIATAKTITDKYAGKFPATYEEIIAMPGIGPYTAAAIASFAFGLPYAVVDGNVQRVLSRYFGIFLPGNSSAVKKCYQDLAGALLETEKPGPYNQAIMDFGAVLCTPARPRCGICPQASDCEALRHGWVERLPARTAPPARKTRWFLYFVIRQADGRIWIRQRTGSDIWSNLYEFVLLETEQPLPQEEWFRQPAVTALIGTSGWTAGAPSRLYRQQLTHQIIQACFIPVTIEKNRPVPAGYEALTPSELKTHPFPRMIAAYLQEPPPAQIPFW